MKALSIGADISWRLAAREAAAAKFEFIEKEHILSGICSLEKVLGQKDAGLDAQEFATLQAENRELQNLFSKIGIDVTKMRRKLRKLLGSGNHKPAEKVIHRSSECRELFNRADKLASSGELTARHLLVALLEQPGSTIMQALGLDEASLKALKEAVLQPDSSEGLMPLLDKFGRDLTKAAADGKLGPFVGRRNELLQVLQTLARSMKSNPVLVGEPGVGKTAIVEALAVRGVQGKDPQVLNGKRIIELNMGALVGGTKYRGEFEERLTKIIEEVRSNPEIILFIDEMHTLIGAGAAGGSMDAANLMKPALARGEIKCIGATTIAEYRKHIESDPALERRFEKIIINEPSRDEAIIILQGLRPKWEEHFKRKITDSALEAAVDLAMKFDKNHFLPDKAVDLVDKAGARLQVAYLSMAPGTKVNVAASGADAVTEMTIAMVLAEKMGLPLGIVTGHLAGSQRPRLVELKPFLEQRIIGQPEAIDRISQRLLMAHAGIGKRNGPLAVFLFLGPTGVGKTELAKSLAEFLFGSASQLIRIDMSEYMEEHSVSKLIGSPPGYIGHDEEGQLTGKLRTRPYAVVLLDEVEKAHPRIFDLFLQVLDDGRITDAKGRSVDARNAIFIMTSNLYQGEKKQRKIGFREEESKSEAIQTGAAAFFRPEFLNRIDDQILFGPLGQKDIERILERITDELFTEIKTRFSANVSMTEEAKAFILQKGYDPAFGVRNLRRAVERLIQAPLSNLVLNGKITARSTWEVICDGNNILIAQGK